MKAGLIAIQPYYLYLEWKGFKIIEIRKSKPKSDVKEWYAYCTKKESDLKRIPAEHREMVKSWFGKVPFKFTLSEVEVITTDSLSYFVEKACLTEKELDSYLGVIRNSNFYHVDWGYAWHISDLQVFDKPMELGEFYISKNCKHYSGFYKDNSNEICPCCNNTACLHNKFSFEQNATICLTDGSRLLTNPPQSWQYVEVNNA